MSYVRDGPQHVSAAHSRLRVRDGERIQFHFLRLMTSLSHHMRTCVTLLALLSSR